MSPQHAEGQSDEPAESVAGSSDPRPYRSVVEIRIHGVSGTPPEELLDRASVRQVGGDAIAGFYRPVHEGQLRDQPPGTRTDRGPWLEGYSWSGWTSGGRLRAFWLFFLPYALVNVAPRMLPVPHAGHRWRGHASGAVLRLLALSLTFTFLIGVSNATTYVVGVRCAGAAEPCAGLPESVVTTLQELTPQARLALATAVSLSFVLGLWLLSFSASRRYGQTTIPDLPPGAAHPEDDALPLARADLWASYGRVRRLRRLHVQFGLISVVAMMGLALPGSTLRWVLLAVAAASAAWSAALVMDRPDAALNDARVSRGTMALRWAPAAATMVLGAVALAATPTTSMTDPRRIRDVFDDLVLYTFLTQCALLIILLALVVADSRTPNARSHPAHLGGRAAWHVAVLGWLVGVMFNAAFMILAPVWITTDGFTLSPSTVTSVMNTRRDWFGATAYTAGAGMLVGVVLIGLGIAALLLCTMFRRITTGGTARDRAALSADYPDLPADADPLRRRAILFGFWLARRVDYVSVAVRWFVWPVVVFLVLQGIALAVPSLPSAVRRWFGIIDGGPDGSLPGAIGLGAYFTVLLLLGMIAVGLLSFRQRSTRRGVGILWDLTCFWPRDVHPFAPPCYTERIVPEVSRRIGSYIRGWTDSEGERGRIVIAAHSQGTVISVAALMSHVEQAPTPRDESIVAKRAEISILSRTALLTFGCVLDRLYARFFPRYFNRPTFDRLAETLRAPDGQDRWINLWRHSDYLGGSVPYSPDRDPVDDDPGPRNVCSVDPLFDMSPEDVVFPRAGRHSYFSRDPAFHRQIGDLVTSFGPAYADCVPDPPPEPPFPEAPPSMT